MPQVIRRVRHELPVLESGGKCSRARGLRARPALRVTAFPHCFSQPANHTARALPGQAPLRPTRAPAPRSDFGKANAPIFRAQQTRLSLTWMEDTETTLHP